MNFALTLLLITASPTADLETVGSIEAVYAGDRMTGTTSISVQLGDLVNIAVFPRQLSVDRVLKAWGMIYYTKPKKVVGVKFGTDKYNISPPNPPGYWFTEERFDLFKHFSPQVSVPDSQRIIPLLEERYIYVAGRAGTVQVEELFRSPKFARGKELSDEEQNWLNGLPNHNGIHPKNGYKFKQKEIEHLVEPAEVSGLTVTVTVRRVKYVK